MRLSIRRRLSGSPWAPPLQGACFRGSLRQFVPAGMKSEIVVNPEPGPRWIGGSLRPFSPAGLKSETVVSPEPGPCVFG
eukprot:11693812-Alexandrium_andersonii.AAC.1